MEKYELRERKFIMKVPVGKDGYCSSFILQNNCLHLAFEDEILIFNGGDLSRVNPKKGVEKLAI